MPSKLANNSTLKMQVNLVGIPSFLSGFAFDGNHCKIWNFRCIWEFTADESFAISEDVWNKPLGRGSEIRLHLRDKDWALSTRH
uniref:Uncharacterized protein n=1 Tax=Nelumbo nucifera TaxID=4432 RepID=A0A822ZNG1_NELNU|nr:TPA_asm: hypothetical protein HUJ06_017471 [Nelumbo nucifera]